MKIFALSILVTLTFVAHAQTPLPRAHAHNDYEHTRPLLDALDQGFGSVEADIYLVNGELLVAHDPQDVKPERTLEKLYLSPLKKRFDERKEILQGLKTLILLVDIKSEAVTTYQALEKKLDPYKSMLTAFTSDTIETNAVTIILSGNRPRDNVAAQPRRWVAIDGRLPDLQTNPPRSLIPLISDNWNNHFKWKQGAFPDDEATRLKNLVAKAHDQGRIIRFWAIPDRPDAWEILHTAKVDLINTDRLADLAALLKAKPH